MPKTTTSLLVEDFYKTELTQDVSNSGDIELTVSTAPIHTKGFIIVDPESSANRERMYYHNVIGNIIYVKGVNRVDPKAHAALDKVQINDTSLIFNYLSKLQSTTFYIEELDSLDINVWGGPTLKGFETVSVVDTLLTVTDGATNYIYYKQLTNEIKTAVAEATVTTDKGIVVAEVVAASGVITTISYRRHGLTTGISIDTVTLAGTVGLVDTYTILFTDGDSSTFNITNGDIGPTGNGINNIVLLSTVGLVKTYRITYTNATTFDYFTTDGVDGAGTGNVIGPNSATNENIAIYDSTTGKLIKDSGINKSAITENTAKVTNATHTGDVIGTTVLTIPTTTLSGKTAVVTLAGTEEVLVNQAGTLKKTTTQDIADLGGVITYPTNIYVSAVTTGTAYGLLLITHNLGLTSADVLQGRYKFTLNTEYNSSTGHILGDTFADGRRSWGTPGYGSLYVSTELKWATADAASPGIINVDTNVVRLKLGEYGNLMNYKCIIQQMY